MYKTKKLYQKNKQFINYVIVSLICTAILYFLYFFITWITDGRYIVANFIAYVVSFTILFILDQKVFNSKPKNQKDRFTQIGTFIVFRGIGFIIDSSLLVLFIEEFTISNVIAKILSSTITFAFNYITNKLFVFKNRFL